jgi:hypothetical protein
MISNFLPAIKYVYIAILYIFVFLSLYSPHMQTIGFGSFFGLQTIFTVIYLFELFMDTNRDKKALSMEIPASKYLNEYSLNMPYWWILVPVFGMQFASSLLMIMTWSYLSKRDSTVPLSKQNEVKIGRWKAFSIIITFALLVLVFAYSVGFNGPPTTSGGPYNLWILINMVFALLLSIINLGYANDLSKLRFTSTDG